jgi:ketosteroid isomerase-like protein
MREGRAPLLWEEALRFVRERDLHGHAGTFAPDRVVELPFPLPGMPRRLAAPEPIRRVLAPVWRARRETDGRMTLGRIEEHDSIVVHPSGDPEVIVVELDLRGGVEASGTPYRLKYVHVLTGASALPGRVRSADDERNRSLVRRYFDLWNSDDSDGAEDLLAPGYVDRAHPEIVGLRGVAESTRRFRAANPGARITIETLVAEGPLVSARTTMRLRRACSDEVLVTSGMAFFRVDGGKLAEQWSCYPRRDGSSAWRRSARNVA